MELDRCIAAMVQLGHTQTPYYPWSFFLSAMAGTGALNGKR